MIKIAHAVFILVFFFLFCSTGNGQDPQFSQFYAAPMYLNPAFTGNTAQGRVAANYRKQWLEVPGAFTSYTFSYDHFLQKYKSGVGVMFLKDQAGTGALTHNSIGGFYSYALNITKSIGLRAGLRASYTTRNLNFFVLKFSDQIILDNKFGSLEAFDKEGISYMDFGAGAIVYSGSYWAGFSLDHLSRPNESFMEEESLIPIKYTVQGGYRYVMVQDAKGNPEQDITAVVIYKGQQDWDQIDIGAYFKYEMFLGGLWYRGIPGFKKYASGYSNNDALVVMLGIQIQDFFHVGYSYDVTISKLGLASRGSHEVSLIYEFAQPDYKRSGKKQNFMVPCTKF